MILKEFYEKRNKILIWHERGGLGDVLMQRMLFEDIKFYVPDAKITFACLPEYFDAVKDHPFIEDVIDSRTVNVKDFGVNFNTCVTIADKHEGKEAPCCERHRSDIWSEECCGFKLQNHNMHIKISEDIKEKSRKKLESYRINDGPLIIFCPISAMINKTLLNWQIEGIRDSLKDKCNLIGLHKKNINQIPCIFGCSLIEWMGYIDAADGIISVDTAAFHLAGGLKKPLVGIFTFINGVVYGQYFDFILVQKHRKDGNWDCGPCFKFMSCPKCKTNPKPCLTELTIEEIINGIEKMLKKLKNNTKL